MRETERGQCGDSRGKSSCLLNIQAIGERRVCIIEVRSKFLSVVQE